MYVGGRETVLGKYVWCLEAYLLIFQFRQKYLVVNYTADSTRFQKVFNESVLFLKYAVISIVCLQRNSHLAGYF